MNRGTEAYAPGVTDKQLEVTDDTWLIDISWIIDIEWYILGEKMFREHSVGISSFS